MLSYIIGKVISINKKSITVESNWTGYVIYNPCPDAFEVGKVKKIYIYKHTTLSNKNSIQEDYYGFINYDQKEMFLKLLTLNGIGPKTAMQILCNDLNLLKNLLANRDVAGLSSLTSINEKLAKQMIENIEISSVNSPNVKISELVNALQSLGYEKKEIDFAINTKEIVQNQTCELSDLISLAIKLIASNTDGINQAQ